MGFLPFRSVLVADRRAFSQESLVKKSLERWFAFMFIRSPHKWKERERGRECKQGRTGLVCKLIPKTAIFRMKPSVPPRTVLHCALECMACVRTWSNIPAGLRASAVVGGLFSCAPHATDGSRRLTSSWGRRTFSFFWGGASKRWRWKQKRKGREPGRRVTRSLSKQKAL